VKSWINAGKTGLIYRLVMANMDKEISLFSAVCAECGAQFEVPCLGDMSYGENLFCSENGKIYAYANAFNANSRLIEVLLPEPINSELFQSALAELADKVLGQSLTSKRHCPNCRSTKVSVFTGKKTGVTWVKPVTYERLLALGKHELVELVSNFSSHGSP